MQQQQIQQQQIQPQANAAAANPAAASPGSRHRRHRLRRSKCSSSQSPPPQVKATPPPPPPPLVSRTSAPAARSAAARIPRATAAARRKARRRSGQQEVRSHQRADGVPVRRRDAVLRSSANAERPCMAFTAIRTATADGVDHHHARAPRRLNAFTSCDARRTARRRSTPPRRDEAVRCVVLTGEGRAFSAGQDLTEDRVPGRTARPISARGSSATTIRWSSASMRFPR